MHLKHAKPDHEVHELIVRRWSPYAWDDREVAISDLAAVFEAARWAASSYNEQPWRWLVARKSEGEAYERLLSCLVEGNQAWAKEVPVLGLGIVKAVFDRNGKPNRAAQHDCGAAAAQLTFEATRRGLAVHQMIGIVPERARELYQIPESLEARTGLAIGYAGDPDALPEALRPRDLAPRERLPLRELVFGGRFGEPAGWL